MADLQDVVERLCEFYPELEIEDSLSSPFLVIRIQTPDKGSVMQMVVKKYVELLDIDLLVDQMVISIDAQLILNKAFIAAGGRLG